MVSSALSGSPPFSLPEPVREDAVRLLLAGLSPGTSASYSACLRRYLAFCDTHGATFPPTPLMVIGFATQLFRTGSSRAAVGTHLSALRSMCVDGGLSLAPFADSRIPRLLAGMARSAPPARPPRSPRLPISGPLLSRLLDSISPSSPLGRSLRAALALGFFGLLRAGEFCFKGSPYTPLLRRHVSWFPSYFSVLLERSKTDRLQRGVTVKVYRSLAPICPVALLSEAWLASPLQSLDAPLLQDDRGLPLSYRMLHHLIKSRSREFGLDPSAFGTHSLRIGGTSQLAASNFSEAQIQALGRWTSECYQRYLRLPDSFFEQAASSLGSSCSSTYGPGSSSAGMGSLS